MFGNGLFFFKQNFSFDIQYLFIFCNLSVLCTSLSYIIFCPALPHFFLCLLSFISLFLSQTLYFPFFLCLKLNHPFDSPTFTYTHTQTIVFAACWDLENFSLVLKRVVIERKKEIKKKYSFTIVPAVICSCIVQNLPLS